MKKVLFTIQEYIDKFLFGRRCCGCQTQGEAICQNCLEHIPFAEETENYGIYGLYDYGNPIVSHAIWNLKYKHKGQEIKLLTKKSSVLMSEIISEHLQSSSQEKITLVPIPQYKRKTETRGFNQSLLIAKWFSKEIPNSKVLNILIKNKDTIPQSHLSDRKARQKNIANTMRVKNNYPPAGGKSAIYILVDDVTTTGATFLESVRALKSAGAKNILCIALAHGYKRK